jgi:alkylation response protein AidB-like acyl-CoA dehydrogenase
MTSTSDIEAWIHANWDDSLTLSDWWRSLADAGLAMPSWPAGLGGTGSSPADSRRITAALGSAGVIGSPTGNAVAMGVPTVLEHGSEEQKNRFVPPVARGEESWCQLFSEPGAGSDLASLTTGGVADGDDFVVSGQKVWNSNADTSDWGMLLFRSNPDVPRHGGITFALIDMDQPGIEVRPLQQMNGDADFCEVFFTEARVRAQDVIGGLGDGWNVARTTLAHERANTAAGRSRGLILVAAGERAGNLHRPVKDLVAAARATESSARARRELLLSSRSMIKLAQDTGLSEDPLTRQQLADYYAHSEVYRLTNQRSRANAKAGRIGPEASIGKLALALLAHRSRDLSLAMLGANGTLAEEDGFEQGRFTHAALSSFIPSIGGGTNEIQRNIIGERSLGLPREPESVTSHT